MLNGGGSGPGMRVIIICHSKTGQSVDGDVCTEMILFISKSAHTHTHEHSKGDEEQLEKDWRMGHEDKPVSSSSFLSPNDNPFNIKFKHQRFVWKKEKK